MHRLRAAAGFASLFLSSVSASALTDSFFRDVRDLTSNGQSLKAEQKVVQALEGKITQEEKEQLLSLRGLLQSNTGQNEAAEATWSEVVALNPLLDDYAYYYRGLARENLHKFDLAEKDYDKAQSLGPNARLKIEILARLGGLQLQNGRAREAKARFQLLEKKARGTPSHPEAILWLARTERKLGQRAAYCHDLLRLYRKHPAHAAVWHWGPDLQSQEFDGEKTECKSSLEDFRQRLRSWLWAGEEARARNEVQQVATRLAEENRDLADDLRASFLLMIGDVDDAYALLTKIFPQRRHDFDFLQRFSTAAARAGDLATAIGASTVASQMKGGSSKGRKALFQSAFWSYQFQDYDGAQKKFRDFLKKNPKSGLSGDARWYLAWMRYLRKDDAGATREFTELLRQRGLGAASRERAQYWLAMSYVRQRRVMTAKPLLEEIAGDPLKSFYSYAAQARLKRLPAPEPGPRRLSPEAPRKNVLGQEVLLTGQDPESFDTATSEEQENEEKLAKETAAAAVAVETPEGEKDETEKDEAAADVTRTEPEIEEPRERVVLASRRFDRAQQLARFGAYGDAKWELYELEQKLRGKDDVKKLMIEYASLGHFNRSSTIAELRFGGVRAGTGDESRKFWEMAFPRAYDEALKKSAVKEGVPAEFVWGIMRAESQYRYDAVSPVGALGLMQIMPGTGKKLADLAGDRDFRAERLLEPPIAVHLGAYYLHRLGQGLDSSWPLVAAAYNAGPHRVHSWLLSFGDLDFDEFIEHIPFLETRNYVKRVVRYAMVYEDLYGPSKRLVDLAAPVKVKGRVELSKKEIWD